MIRQDANGLSLVGVWWALYCFRKPNGDMWLLIGEAALRARDVPSNSKPS